MGRVPRLLARKLEETDVRASVLGVLGWGRSERPDPKSGGWMVLFTLASPSAPRLLEEAGALSADASAERASSRSRVRRY